MIVVFIYFSGGGVGNWLDIYAKLLRISQPIISINFDNEN